MISRLLHAPVSPWWAVAADMAIRDSAFVRCDFDERVAIDELYWRLEGYAYAVGVAIDGEDE